MSKMRYFNNKFSKIASVGDSAPPATILRFWWHEVVWFAQCSKVFFQTDYGKIKLKNQLWRHFSHVIVITTPKTSPN